MLDHIGDRTYLGTLEPAAWMHEGEYILILDVGVLSEDSEDEFVQIPTNVLMAIADYQPGGRDDEF